MSKFEGNQYPDATAIEDAGEAYEWAKEMFKRSPADILASATKYMWVWAFEKGEQFARDDANILQRYTSDMHKTAYDWAGDFGLRVNTVGGICDVARAGFTRGYTGYMESHPLVCDCCGQPLPPKEG